MTRLPWNEWQSYRLNFRPRMWPSGLSLAISLTLDFQGQIWNLPFLNQKVRLPQNEKQISNELQTSNVTNGFDFGNDLDLWIFKVKCDLDLWPYAGRPFLTMTTIICWSRSGVRINHIVTGVTPNVSVPSTHLVNNVVARKMAKIRNNHHLAMN